MPNIHHALFIAAPAETVYDALTSQSGLSAWWTPNATATPRQFSVARFPFGEGYFKEMRIEELKSPVSVKWKCITGAEEWINTSISFKLESGEKENLRKKYPEIKDQLRQNILGADGTLLIFHQEGWRNETLMFAECNYTWGQFLKSLKLFCETGE